MVPFLCLLLSLRTGYLPELILDTIKLIIILYQRRDPDANRLGMSLTGSYPVKISAIKNLETLS